MFRNNNSTAILPIAAAVLLVSSGNVVVINSIVNAQTTSVAAAACVGMTATENSGCTDGSLPQLAVCTVPAQLSLTAGPDDAVYQACCPNNNLNGFLDNMTCVLWANYNGNVVTNLPAVTTPTSTLKDNNEETNVEDLDIGATTTEDSAGSGVVLSMFGITTATATATAIAATTALLYGL